MAFTPDGMFYLSQKDLQPSMDAIGTGFRGMLGLQNKEEAVNTILQDANYDTPEGRIEALNRIKSIDPDAYMKYAEINRKYEADMINQSINASKARSYQRQVDIQYMTPTKKTKLEIKRDASQLGKQYIKDEQASDIQEWLFRLNPAWDTSKVRTLQDAAYLMKDYLPDKEKTNARLNLRNYITSQNKLYVDERLPGFDASSTTTTEETGAFNVPSQSLYPNAASMPSLIPTTDTGTPTPSPVVAPIYDRRGRIINKPTDETTEEPFVYNPPPRHLGR